MWDSPPPPAPAILTPRKTAHKQVGEISLEDVERKLLLEERAVRLEGGRTDIVLRRCIGYVLLSLFVVNTLAALAVIYLVGVGTLALSDKVVIAVLTATVVQAATILHTVVRYLFKLQ